jgi:hypothetical protein
MPELKTLLIFLLLFVAYAILFIGVSLWLMRRARKGRSPVGKDQRLLRLPGEHLREQLDVLNDTFTESIFAGVVIPVLVLALPFAFLPLVPESSVLWLLLLILAGFIISFVIRVRRLIQLKNEQRKLRLGLMGERLVAEHLADLRGHGFHVFHDLPAQGSAKAFNLDHVVVGPSGVFVIETKARSKPNPTAIENDHRLSFDDKGLHWPTGLDTKSPEQARLNAHWLTEWIHKQLGFKPEITPILAIPGWWVERKGPGGVITVSHKQLASVIRGPEVLNPKVIDQIRRQLDTACRTIAPDL